MLGGTQAADRGRDTVADWRVRRAALGEFRCVESQASVVSSETAFR
jgi:hypothetical protein